MTKYNLTQTKIPSENSTRCENDEISIVELYIVLVRRKRLVIFTMVIAVFIAIAYLWLVKSQAKPVYQAEVVVQVGQIALIGKQGEVAQVEQIENLKKLKQRLKVVYPFIKEINSKRNIFTITVNAHTREEAEQQLKKITDQLLQKHSDIYNAEIDRQRQKYEFQRRKSDTIRSQMAELTHLIDVMKKTEPVQSSILVLEKNNLIQSLSALEEKAADLNWNIRKIRSVPTKLIHEASITDISVNPKVSQVIILSIVIGLMIGSFNAFIAEFIIKVRQRMADIEK